jgi:hypothetical protein
MIYLLPEDGTSLTIDHSRQIHLKYILRASRYYTTESEDFPADYILPSDLIDLDQIENTRHVERLPDIYSEETKALLEIPFDISKTKASRTTLQEIPDCNIIWHLQDTVQFYEAITYIPIEYCHLPEDEYSTIRHIRHLSQPIRRKVFADYPLHKKRCTHPFVQINDIWYLDHWVDQHKRDLTKYKPGNGILLIKEDRLPYLRDNYWNSLIGLTKAKGVRDDDIEVRITECAFLTLRFRYPGDVEDFYLRTTHQPILRKYERSTPVRHTPLILRSLSNGLTIVFITNRAPDYISDLLPLHIYPSTFPVDILPVPTYLNYRSYFHSAQTYQNRSGRISLHGIPFGVHNQFREYNCQII